MSRLIFSSLVASLKIASCSRSHPLGNWLLGIRLTSGRRGSPRCESVKTIPFLMILGGIASFSAIALPFVSFIPLYVSLPFLWIFEKIVFLFSDFPLLVLNEISPIFFLGYYLILFSIVLMIKKRKYHES